MSHKELIIVKLGGSVLTRKDEGETEVNEGNLERLSAEIAQARKEKDFDLVLVHGAGPFGHIPAKEYGLDTGYKDERQAKGFCVTHQSMEKLNYRVVKALQAKGLHAVSFQPSSCGVLKDRRLIRFPTDIIKKLVGYGITPVAYGDVLLDEKTGMSILSGDHLVPYLAGELKADRIIMAADVPGIFDSDPKKNHGAKLLKEVSRENLHLIKEIGSSKGVDVTGGMKRKLDELLRLAESGTESEIVDATKPGLLKRALSGERGLGTIIKANI